MNSKDPLSKLRKSKRAYSNSRSSVPGTKVYRTCVNNKCLRRYLEEVREDSGFLEYCPKCYAEIQKDLEESRNNPFTRRLGVRGPRRIRSDIHNPTYFPTIYRISRMRKFG